MRIWLGVILLILGSSQVLMADEHIRDYYQEPGLNPFKEDAGTKNFEFIDPFSGTLQLKHLDVSLPGNGGLDMNVYRVYTPPQGATIEHSAVGVGWTMHPGRLVITTGQTDICAQIDGSLPLNNHAHDNPAFEMPDGSRKQFYRDIARDNSQYISQDNWRLQCVNNAYLVTSPAGTRYYATAISQSAGTNITSWYVTAIQDIHGNTIQIGYITGYPGSVAGKQIDYLVMHRMYASDGREITFEYLNLNNLLVKLNRIEVVQSNTQRTWYYQYDLLDFTSPLQLDYNLLTNVVRPDNSQWRYDYLTPQTHISTDPQLQQFPGFLEKVHYPFSNGSYICYEYKKVEVQDAVLSFHYSNSIFRKTLNNCSDVTGARLQPSWEYTYTRNGNTNDLVVIDYPDQLGRVEYEYQSLGSFYPQFQGNLWRVGLLLEKKTYDRDDLVEAEVSSWDSRVISADQYKRGGTYYDLDTRVAQLESRQITRYGGGRDRTYTTTYQDYDAFGNPGTIIENGEGSRTTAYTYFNNTNNWILGKNQSETIPGVGTISRIYAPDTGNLDSETKYGVTTSYTYHPHGGVQTVTDARQNTTTYWNYYRGIARNEAHPEGVNIDRVVSDWGTITSETNGRRFTTVYGYDAMNRVDSITLPRTASEPVSLTWNSQVSDLNLGVTLHNARELVRGNFRQVQQHDGFGRLSNSLASDLGTNTHIRVSYGYDALDRKTFEAYPRYATAGNWDALPNTVPGTIYEYDIFNRPTRITHPDANYITYTYYGDNTVDVRDENGNVTTHYYRAFGHPDQKSLAKIDAPESIRTVISRNEIDQVTNVWQGQANGVGFDRVYTYDSRRFLDTITHPETGITDYSYDDTGNLVSKSVGSSNITLYGYDNLNRLRTIDYPGTAPVASFTYDANNNVRAANNSNSQRAYVYDVNDNLERETITVGSRQYVIRYDYDSLDNLAVMTYPWLRQVDYAPDAFGRPTQAQPFVNSVYFYPSGQMEQIAYMNGIVTDFTLDERLRVQKIQTAGLAPVGDLTYDYYPNGNVHNIINVVESQYTRGFTYDGVNRLLTATGIWGNASFNYDVQGNLRQRSIGGEVFDYNYETNRLRTVMRNNALLYTFDYDDYGNIIGDDRSRTMVFDDAQNMINAHLSGDTIPQNQNPDFTFAYDANNMRVGKWNDGWHGFLYAKNSNLLAELQTDINETVQHFYLGSQRIASIKGLPTPEVHAGPDQIATEGDVITLDGSGTIVPSGDTVSYLWVQISGQRVSIENFHTSVATVNLPSGVNYIDNQLIFELRVTSNTFKTGSYKDRVTINVEIIDTDQDGLSDVWEMEYFGEINTYGPNDDPDADGYSNAEEYKLGLDPVIPQQLEEPNGVIVKPDIGYNTVYWLPLDRATSYDLYWSTTPNVDISNANVFTNVASPFIHSNTEKGQTYYYKLVARNQCCASESLEYQAATDRRNWSMSAQILHYVSPNSYPNISTYAGVKQPASYHTSGSDGFEIVWEEHGFEPIDVVEGSHHDFLGNMYVNLYGVNLYSQRFDFSNGWGSKILIDSYQNRYFTFNDVNVIKNNVGDVIAYYISHDETLNARKLHVYFKSSNLGWNKLQELDLSIYSLSVKVNLNMGDQGLVRAIIFDDSTISYTEYSFSEGWSEVVNLFSTDSQNPEEILRVSVDSNSNGGIAVTWCHSNDAMTDKPSISSLLYSPNAGWSNPLIHSIPATSCFYSGYGFKNHFQVAINSNNHAILVSSTYDGGSQRSYYAERFSRDGVTQSDQLTEPMFRIRGYGSLDIPFYGYNTSYSPIGLIGSVIYGTDDVAHVSFIEGMDSDGWGAVLVKHHPDTGWDIPVTPVTGWQYYATQQNLIQVDDAIHFIYSYQDNYIIDGEIKENLKLPVPDDFCQYDYYSGSENYEYLSRHNSGIAVINDACESNSIKSIQFFWDFPYLPVSRAGNDRFVDINDLVALDGSGSSDDYGIVSYNWTQISGPEISIINANSALALFVATESTWNGVQNTENILKNPIVIELTVTDEDGYTDRDSVSIYVDAKAPIANAGDNISIDYFNDERRSITLDGSASVDHDGAIVAYDWTIQNASSTSSHTLPGPELTIIDADSASPQIDLPYELDINARYLITLTVTDNNGMTDTDTIYLTLHANQPPLVNAGPDIYVFEGETITLSGQVTDPEGQLRQTFPYFWSRISGPSTPQFDAYSLTTSFIAPEVNGVPIIWDLALYATDNFNQSSNDTVRIVVRDQSQTDLDVPVVTPPNDVTLEAIAHLTPVDLGTATATDVQDGVLTPMPNRTGPFSVGTHTITWSATDSAGNIGIATQSVRVVDTTPPTLVPPPDILMEGSTSQFIDIGWPVVSDATNIPAGNITNNAPDRFQVGVTYVTWTVRDQAGNQAAAVQTITVQGPSANASPVANPGPDQVVSESLSVTLNGTASNDPDGSIVSYQWTQTAGPSVTLDSDNTATASFTAPDVTADTVLTFSLTVTDNQGATASASVTITVLDAPTDTTPPVLIPPPDLVVEATAVLTTVNLGTASANDDVDGPLMATPDQTGPFALGEHTIWWSAVDAAGNTALASQLLVVEDTTEPDLTVPDDITVTGASPIAVDIGMATATDIFTPITITHNAPALFPVGTTTVTWTATDPNGNTGTATQAVTVEQAVGVLLVVSGTNPATTGEVVDLTGQLVGLSGDYEYRFRIRGPATGDVWQVLRGYQTNPSHAWNTSGYLGQHRLQVQARPVGTRETPLRDGQNIWVNDDNAATAVTLATDLPNPQYSGALVTLSAQAEGGSGNYEYQFRVRGPSTGDVWVVLRDYAANDTAQWDTASVTGRHRIQVRARNVGSDDKPVQTGQGFWLNALDALTGVSITTTPASPQSPGTLVTLMGAPNGGGNGTYAYQFRIRGPATAGVWQVLRDWSTDDSYQWDTTGYTGMHRIQVRAINAGSEDRPVRTGQNFSVQ